MTSSLLNDEFWSGKYATQQAIWNIGYASPPLTEYIDQLTDKDIRILIPGCGNAYEAAYLLEKGFTHVTLLDISTELVNRLQERFKGQPISIIHGDFFQHQQQYDLILEQTFLSALDPSQRKDYVTRLSELLLPGATLAGVVFNKEFNGGPPFGGNRTIYQELFELKLYIKTMELCYNSIEERKGDELFIILKNII